MYEKVHLAVSICLVQRRHFKVEMERKEQRPGWFEHKIVLADVLSGEFVPPPIGDNGQPITEPFSFHQNPVCQALC